MMCCHFVYRSVKQKFFAFCFWFFICEMRESHLSQKQTFIYCQHSNGETQMNLIFIFTKQTSKKIGYGKKRECKANTYTQFLCLFKAFQCLFVFVSSFSSGTNKCVAIYFLLIKQFISTRERNKQKRKIFSFYFCCECGDLFSMERQNITIFDMYENMVCCLPWVN